MSFWSAIGLADRKTLESLMQQIQELKFKNGKLWEENKKPFLTSSARHMLFRWLPRQAMLFVFSPFPSFSLPLSFSLSLPPSFPPSLPSFLPFILLLFKTGFLCIATAILELTL